MSEQRTKNKQFSILEEEQNLDEYYLVVEGSIKENHRVANHDFDFLSSWISDVDRALVRIELIVRFW